MPSFWLRIKRLRRKEACDVQRQGGLVPSLMEEEQAETRWREGTVRTVRALQAFILWQPGVIRKSSVLTPGDQLSSYFLTATVIEAKECGQGSPRWSQVL